MKICDGHEMKQDTVKADLATGSDSEMFLQIPASKEWEGTVDGWYLKGSLWTLKMEPGKDTQDIRSESTEMASVVINGLNKYRHT